MKPFPSIQYCLVCEEVRREVLRKSSLLGFYGIAPDVEILIRELKKPIERLTFLFLTTPGGGKFRIGFKLTAPSGTVVAGAEGLDIEIEETHRRNNIALGFDEIKFAEEGLHTLVFTVEGSVLFQTTFGIRQGRPDDFQA